jgi:hypothetical protein
MAAHNKETSRVEEIAKFGKRQLTSLDEKSFSELLALVGNPVHITEIYNDM